MEKQTTTSIRSNEIKNENEYFLIFVDGKDVRMTKQEFEKHFGMPYEQYKATISLRVVRDEDHYIKKIRREIALDAVLDKR